MQIQPKFSGGGGNFIAPIAQAEDAAPSLEELLEQRAELDKAIAMAEEDEIIQKAIEALTDYWTEEVYQDESNNSKDGYLEIKWARVVYIKDDVTGTGTEQLAEMNCYVEFFLLSDYLGSAPYYSHVGISECVAFKKDGSFEVLRQDPILIYRTRTYQLDFEPIIESISDRGSDFNQVFALLD